MGLLNELRKYVKDALPGGLLNPEVNRQGILDGAALSTTAVPVLGDILGLGADLNRYANEPESRTLGNFALSGLGMLPFVPAMTAWHGSPHKFDKFSLDKIGTGEGAQAYGHGLYLAESPGVASEYKTALSNPEIVFPNGKRLSSVPDGTPIGMAKAWLEDAFVNRSSAPYQYASKGIRDLMQYEKDPSASQKALEILGKLEGKGATMDVGGNLYKTDIPDEAVARFLDWDKPLSQQAPEVQAALSPIFGPNSLNLTGENLYQKAASFDSMANVAAKTGGDTARIKSIFPNATDREIQQAIAKSKSAGSNDAIASQILKDSGIPGIRYLDGGSRNNASWKIMSPEESVNGKWNVSQFGGNNRSYFDNEAEARDFLQKQNDSLTSNFVVFDPALIRILERNGVPTGQQPWKQGESSLGGLLRK